jgi:hypothetical protein
MSRAWYHGIGIYKRNYRTNGRKVSGLIHVFGRLDEVDAAEVKKELCCWMSRELPLGRGMERGENPFEAIEMNYRESKIRDGLYLADFGYGEEVCESFKKSVVIVGGGWE